MTELDAFAIKRRKSHSGKTYMIPRSAIHGYSYPNGIYESTGTIPLVFVLTETGVLDIDYSVVAFATSTACSCSSGSTAIIPRLVLVVFLDIVRLPSDASCTISIVTGCELYETVFLSAGKFPFPKVLMKEVPSKTETFKFLTIPSTTRIRASPMCMWSIIVLKTSTFRFVALCS